MFIVSFFLAIEPLKHRLVKFEELIENRESTNQNYTLSILEMLALLAAPYLYIGILGIHSLIPY